MAAYVAAATPLKNLELLCKRMGPLLSRGLGSHGGVDPGHVSRCVVANLWVTHHRGPASPKDGSDGEFTGGRRIITVLVLLPLAACDRHRRVVCGLTHLS